MNKFSKPLEVQYVNTHVPIPVDHLIRSGEQLQGKRDRLEAAQGETLARYMDIEPDRLGLTTQAIDAERGRAETDLDGMLQGRDWLGAMPQIQRYARDSHRRLQPIVATAGQVNTSLDQIEALNLSPEEKLLRQAALRVHATSAIGEGRAFQARSWSAMPNFMEGFARSLALVAPENEQGEPTTNPDGSIRIDSVQRLSPEKLERAMALYRQNNPDAVRYVDEMREALSLTNPEFAALTPEAQRTNIAGRLNLPALSSEIAALASYENNTYNLSGGNSPAATGDGDEDGEDDVTSPLGTSESTIDDPGQRTMPTTPEAIRTRIAALNGRGARGESSRIVTALAQRGWYVRGSDPSTLQVKDAEGRVVDNTETRAQLSRLRDIHQEVITLQSRLHNAENEHLGGLTEEQYLTRSPGLQQRAQAAYTDALRSPADFRSASLSNHALPQAPGPVDRARAERARARVYASDPAITRYRQSLSNQGATEAFTALGASYGKSEDANRVRGAVESSIMTVPMTNPQTGVALNAADRDFVSRNRSTLSAPIVRYNPVSGDVEHLFTVGPDTENPRTFATKVPDAEAAHILNSTGRTQFATQVQGQVIRGLRQGGTRTRIPLSVPLPNGTQLQVNFEVRRRPGQETFDIYENGQKWGGDGQGGFTRDEAGRQVARIFLTQLAADVAETTPPPTPRRRRR